MQETENPWRSVLCAALVFCAALALYTPFLSDRLLWDDGTLIGENAFLADCSNLPAALSPLNLFRILPVPMAARPLVNASLLADACAGSGPAAMKFTNLLLHGFSAAALFFLLLALSGSEAGALLGALLFAVHPAAAEAIHVITFRSHLLGAFFFIPGLSFALFFSRRPSPAAGAAAALCYLLALLSVETPAVLPLAALLAAYFDSGRAGLKKLLPLLGVMAAVALFYLWFRTPRAGYGIAGLAAPGIPGPSPLYPVALLPANGPAAGAYMMPLPWRGIYTSFAANVFTMSRITLEYLGTMLAGLGLNTDYSPAVTGSLRRGLVPLAAVLAVLGGGVRLYRRRNLAGLGLLLALAALLPALNFVPVYNIKAARYLYLPLAGLAVAAAGLLKAALANKKIKNAALAAAVLWVSGLAAVTASRNPEFRSDLTLFSAAVRRAPAMPRAQANLSRALLLAGDCAGGLAHAGLAAGLDKGNPVLRLRLAFALDYCGRRPEALREAEGTLKQFPGDAFAVQLVKALRAAGPARAGR